MVNILTQALIIERLRLAGWTSTLVNPEQLCRFIDLLSKWNRKINLTSLQLEPLSVEAVDRLIVEPVLASRFIRQADARIVDLGSGGGSPAIPLKIQLPASSLRMVESRSRKCAFLREATRQLGLENSFVHESRFELLVGREELRHATDVMTIRAVRLDEQLVDLIRWFLTPGGELLRFSLGGDVLLPAGAHVVAVHELIPANSSNVQVIRFD